MAQISSNNSRVIGIVFGKFFPPHNGHVHLIETASKACSQLFIVVCASEQDVPSGHQRAYWIQQLAPRAEVLLTSDLCDWHFGSPCVDECSVVWARWTKQHIPPQIDVVFSSETYGDRFAGLIGAAHVNVDILRGTHSVSATDIRHDYAKNWDQLPAVVQSGMHRKLVIMGVESSGTTTLTSDVAEAINAPWVAEVGRTVSWELALRDGGMENANWDESVFWSILREQARAETEARHRHKHQGDGALGPWIVCDTDAVATVVWWERYLDSPSDSAWHFAQADLGDIYVVTDPLDVDFHQDGIRDGEHLRLSMHEKFLEIAQRTDRPFVLASGDREMRVQQVLRALENLETEYPRFVTN